MIIDNEIKIRLNNRYVSYYKEKGYVNIKGNQEVIIKTEDLPENSHYEINVQCDKCKITKKIKYYNYIINIRNNKIYICNNCKGEVISNSNINKYGVKSTLQLDSVKEKSKQKMIELYGVDHFSKSKEFKERLIKKFGVPSSLLVESIKEKSKNTIIKKYGVDHFSKSKEFKEKTKKTCVEKYGVNSYSKTNSFKEKIRLSVLEKLMSKNNLNIIDYENNFITAICEKNHIYKIHRHILKNRINYGTQICTICNPIGSFSSSGYEKQVQEFIKNINIEIQLNNRNIISNELDIYVPEFQIGIEFNGLWWHNELNKPNNYHLNKTEECEKNGIQLIHIYEDDWLYKQDIIKSIILNRLNKTEYKIFARKCEIGEIYDNKLVKNFLEINHVQGYINSKIKIGLFYNNELVSLMTFGNRRIAMGKKSTNKGEYEMLRFCSTLNTNVVGGANKLFNYFIKKYDPEEIITYADRSFSQGKLYEKLGFQFIDKTQPNYYYVIDGIRYHRFNFRKDRLVKEGFDPNKTEHEIMLERKIYRIYDSGNLKFIYTKKT